MVAFGFDGDSKLGGVDGLALSDQNDVDQISVSRAGSVAGERARHGDELVGEVGSAEATTPSGGTSRDGGRIVSGGDDATVRVWDAATTLAVAVLLSGDGEQASSAALSGDRSALISAGPNAWRWLRVRGRDASGRHLGAMPYEWFFPPKGSASQLCRRSARSQFPLATVGPAESTSNPARSARRQSRYQGKRRPWVSLTGTIRRCLKT